jgi:hypothetical protein
LRSAAAPAARDISDPELRLRLARHEDGASQRRIIPQYNSLS